MATLGDLKTRIAGDLNRTDQTALIATEIARAIERYAAKRFWFTVGSGTTATASGVATAAAPTGLRVLDAAWVTVSGVKMPLEQHSLATITDWLGATPNATGRPTDFALSGSTWTFYRLPNAIYTVTAVGIYDLTALDTDSATNAWTTEAQDLIANEVLGRIRRIRLRDYPGADAAGYERDQALKALRGETTRRLMTGVHAS